MTTMTISRTKTIGTAAAAASWQNFATLVAFAFCACGFLAIGSDALAPSLHQRTRIGQTPNGVLSGSNPFAASRSGFAVGQQSPRQTTIRRNLSPNEDDNGVPSTPLDRPVLSAIDASSLLVFAAVGKASHSAVDGSLDIGAVLVTAFPFLLSWFLLSPLVGSYKPEATKDVQSSAIQAAKGWILAVPVGCVLRGVIKGYVPPLPFVIVTLISTLVILSTGRVGYTVLSELYVEMF